MADIVHSGRKPTQHVPLINLTPHDINIHLGDGSIVTIPRSGLVARCETQIRDLRPIFGPLGESIPYHEIGYGQVQNLPAKQEGTLFIVSALVAQQFPRGDLVIVDDLVRDEQGQVIGCRSLAWLRA